ncbi:hypothetical protein D3C81_2138630 [compost metagenome]
MVIQGWKPPSAIRSSALKNRPLPSTQKGCLGSDRWPYLAPSQVMWSKAWKAAARLAFRLPATLRA